LDNLEYVVTPDGLAGGYLIHKRALEIFEKNCYPIANFLCEPQLGKRGLYPTLSTKENSAKVRTMMNLLTYADGKLSLLEIASIIGKSFFDLLEIAERLAEENVITLESDLN